MGTVAVQTQCCLKADESKNEDGTTVQEGTAVQIVDALHWGHGNANAADRPVAPPVVLPRACSEASTIFVP